MFHNGKMKKTNYFLFAFLNCLLVLISCLLVSFSTQTVIGAYGKEIVSTIVETNSTGCFTAGKQGKRTESYIDSASYPTLLNKFYSFAVASRFLDEHIYLEAKTESVTMNYDLSLVESIDKPKDSENYIAHGNLPIVESEIMQVDNFRTNYGFLSKEIDSIYIPSDLAQLIIKDFSLSRFDDFLFSENENIGYKNLVSFSIKTNLDQEYSFGCRVRGVYSIDSGVGKVLDFLSNNTIICSYGMVDQISILPNKLLIAIKATSKTPNRTFNFLNFLDSELFFDNVEFDFSKVINDTARQKLTSMYLDFTLSFYNVYNFVFLILGGISFLLWFCFNVFSTFRKQINWVFSLSSSLFFVTIFILFGRLLTMPFIFPTNFSVYLSTGFLFFLFVFLLLLKFKPIKNINPKISIELNDFYEVNI